MSTIDRDADAALAGFAPSKFAAPALPRHHVPRPALCAHLDASAHPLRLVVGSPGAGKSTLLAEWTAHRPHRQVCWLSVDRGDGEPTRFWQGFIGAVRTVHGDFGGDALDLLRLHATVDHEVLESLLVDATRLDAPLAVVIDDLHAAGPEVHQQVGFLLSRDLEGMRLVIGARAEPKVGLHRLRLDDRLTELRDPDLRFDTADAARLLARLGVDLDDDHLGRVVERTEGWAAGLHLAALALHDADDAEGVVVRLAGTNRVISHYLWSEVFEAQPPDVRRFLLDTCVVDELSPSLARALSPDNPVSLLDVEDANLLLRRLDADGTAFRFHHLLTDLLRFRLRATDAGHEAELHRRAARWYDEQGDPVGAFRHGWLSGDRTEALRSMHGTVLDVGYEDIPDLDRLERALADDDIEKAPGPAASFAAALITTGHLAAADRFARRIVAVASDLLDPDGREQVVAVRAITALLMGDTRAAIEIGEQASVAASDDTWPVLARTIVAKARLWEGELEEARDELRHLLPRHATPFVRMEVDGTLAHVHLAIGDLDAADSAAAEVLAGLSRDGATHLADGVLSRTVQGVVWLERGATDQAEEALRSITAVSTRVRVPPIVLANVALSRLWAVDGRPDAARLALSVAHEAIEARPARSGMVDHVRAQAVRLHLSTADVDGAVRTLEEMAPGPPRDLLRAEVDLATGLVDRARRGLDELSATWEPTPRRCLDVELARLRVALASGEGTAEAASAVLDTAGPSGFVFPFAEAGHDALVAIRAEAHRRARNPFIDRVLRLRPPVVTPDLAGDERHAPTGRERVVLRYMATSMSYSEIADELRVSVNTVKTHAKHINTKLGASSRQGAVDLARRLRYL